jgi:serine/threonine-protein kinase
MNVGPGGTQPGLRSGATLGGKYRLLRLIGEGGMGEVYEAQHLVVGRRFAVKFLHAHLAHHGDALTRFRREAQAAGALESEHIAAVVDLDAAEDGAPFLVMEYLQGESVAELLRREGPLPVTRAVGIVLQACRGLEVAHAAGIVHRDLKPDNLFSVRRADGSELVKILDFGIAKLVRDDAPAGLTRSGAMVGTPFYMAPEQARGEKNLDARVDVYALGVILYELLSLAKPHPGDSHNAILAHILTEPITPLERLRTGLPSGLLAVIERTLSNSRDARPSTVAGLARELVPFAGREVIAIQSHFDLRELASAKTLPTPDTHALSVPPPAPPRSTQPMPTRGKLAWLPASALAVAGSIGVWSLLKAPGPQSSDLQVRSSSPSAELTPTAAAASGLARSPSQPSAVPSLTASAAGAALPPSTSSGRLAGRPKLQAKPRAPSPAAVPSASSKPRDSLVKQSSPQVDFDTQNPYQ